MSAIKLKNSLNGMSNGYTNGHTEEVDHSCVNGHSKHVPKPVNEDNENFYTYELLEAIADYLLAKANIHPKIGIICGSGMSPLADNLEDKVCLPYSTIPHFPESTVVGHEGQLVFGKLNNVPVMCMQGRFHFYEGFPLWKCCMPVRIMKLLGISHLIASNAAGGLNENYKIGDIMIIKDHVNMLGFAGNNPLVGGNDERFGPRFPAMNRAYDLELRNIAKEVAVDMGITNIVREGVYTCVGGPNFETVAELRMLKVCGIDAVGMSTVHEVITAVHCGMKVFAFSLITNECITDYDTEREANHEEVIDTASTRTKILQDMVAEIVTRIPM
ncbi:purine nucleoside phosphorylase [Anabrus simplex]|uniref:purine nucleoside phosphorylase n=1 Tax=Anabrus simplex TaxID=316456 RepID=UPI0035A33DB9